MTVDDLLAQLHAPGVAVEQLLEQCRAPDLSLWEQHPDRLYPEFVQRLIQQGHPGRALDLAREGERHLRDHSRLRYQLALAAARGGNPRYAEELLTPLLAAATGPDDRMPADMDPALRVDVVALRGRILKDRSRREPALAAESARWYEKAAALPGADTFPLINAATMWRLAGDRAKSDALAAEVVARLPADAAERAAAAGDVWPALTLGEAAVLLDHGADAVRWYTVGVGTATGRRDYGVLAAARNNLRRLADAGATIDPHFLDAQLGSVVVFTGHLLDSPDRQAAGGPPRFPNHPPLVAAVAAAVRDRLDALNAKVGFCSLGCGADILFAEVMLERKAELHVVLPCNTRDFLRTSVDFGQDGPDWQEWRMRFDRIIQQVRAASKERVRYVTAEPYLGSTDLFGFANAVLQGLAVLRARERTTEPVAVAVIDRSSAGAAGGTADFLAEWGKAGYRAEEIDLACLRAGHPGSGPAAPPAPPLPDAVLPRPVKAMLFADVAGYSGIPEWQLTHFLTEYAGFLKAVFGSAAGTPAVYANTWGDGLYVVFDRVADAAAFAVELVDPVCGLPPAWARYGLGQTCPFRVGLHAGPVFELPDVFQGRPGYAGRHVNRAARIEPVTVRGCAYASEPFAALLTMQAGDRFAAEAVGVHSLAKEYDRCPLYRVTRAGG